MDALESPKEGGGLRDSLQDSNELEMPSADYMKVKCYFYTEEEDLRKEVFPEQWFKAMEEESGEPIDRDEVPAFEVCINCFPTCTISPSYLLFECFT